MARPSQLGVNLELLNSCKQKYNKNKNKNKNKKIKNLHLVVQVRTRCGNGNLSAREEFGGISGHVSQLQRAPKIKVIIGEREEKGERKYLSQATPAGS
jgi:hypothetical protein